MCMGHDGRVGKVSHQVSLQVHACMVDTSVSGYPIWSTETKAVRYANQMAPWCPVG